MRRHLPEAPAPVPAEPARRMDDAGSRGHVLRGSGPHTRQARVRVLAVVALSAAPADGPDSTRTRVVLVRLLTILTFRPAPSCTSGCVWPESPGLHVLVEVSVVSVELSAHDDAVRGVCLLYTSPSPRDGLLSRMPSSA